MMLHRLMQKHKHLQASCKHRTQKYTVCSLKNRKNDSPITRQKSFCRPTIWNTTDHLNSQVLAAMGNVRTTTRTNIIWYAKDFIMITSLRNAVVSSQLQPYLLAVTSSSSSAVILEFTYGSVCLSTFYFFSFIAS